ncbi:hypothetical protein ACFPRL_07205 [Pseudoclavibacter helvolus]
MRSALHRSGALHSLTPRSGSTSRFPAQAQTCLGLPNVRGGGSPPRQDHGRAGVRI